MNKTLESTTTYNILHVENQQSWSALLARALSSMPQYKLTTTDNVGWAESALENPPYDLALIDLHLNDGEHGNRVIAHILKNYPQTRIALLSGTLSDKARKSIEEQELGLLYIPKDELLTSPDRVRTKIEFIVRNNFPSQRDQRALETILNEELSFTQIPQIHMEIDALKPDLFHLRNYLADALASHPLRERILHLTHVPSLYGSNPQDSYSRVHDYKGQWAIATEELSRNLQEGTKEAYKSMTLMLSKLVSLLDSSQGNDFLNVSQMFNREVSRLEKMYPEVQFTLDSGDTKWSDPRRFFIHSSFRESLRILLSNAAEAYEGYSGEKKVEVDTVFTEGSIWNNLYVRIRNGGKYLPDMLAKEPLYEENIHTTKPTGTQFGLRRVLELGRRGHYDLGFSGGEGEETLAKVKFGDRGFEIRRVEKNIPSSLARVLLVDHSGDDYVYLKRAEKDLGCSIDYIRSHKEFEDTAKLYAQEYDALILHPTAGYVEVAQKMREKNPHLGMLVCSGHAPHQQTARKILPSSITVTGHMPHEKTLKRWLRRFTSKKAQLSSEILFNESKRI